jgi:hypothetical protein
MVHEPGQKSLGEGRVKENGKLDKRFFPSTFRLNQYLKHFSDQDDPDPIYLSSGSKSRIPKGFDL